MEEIGIIFLVLVFGLIALLLVSQWIIYQKAGQEGWAAIVPIYNYIILLKIVNKPTWWIFLMLIPIVNIVIGIILIHRLSLSFGKDVGFTLGLIFLSFIFYPLLAFGDAQYVGIDDGINRE